MLINSALSEIDLITIKVKGQLTETNFLVLRFSEHLNAQSLEVK